MSASTDSAQAGPGLADLPGQVRALVRAALDGTAGDDAARDRQAAFQGLIAELATGFLGLTPGEFDEALGSALGRIASFAGAERAVLARVDPASRRVSVTHEWAAAGDVGALRSVHGQRGLPWALERLDRGEVIHVEDADELPEGAALERKAWDLFGLQSILAVPVRAHDGLLLGFAAFATTSRRAAWREEERPLFDLAADMLRSAFETSALLTDLERAELRLRRLLDSGAVGILAADAEGRIWEANEAALAVVGATREDLEAGRVRWDEATPAEYRPMTQGALEQLERAGCSEPWEQDVYRSDGSRVSIVVCLARLPETEDRFLMYAVDITSTKQAERELALRNRLGRLITLYSTRLIAVPPARIGETIDEVLRETGRVLGIDRATVWLDDGERGDQFRCRHAWDRKAPVEGLERIPPLVRNRFPQWDDDFRARRAMVVRDVTVDWAEGSLERRFLEGHGVRSGVAVPLIARAEPVGFATFSSESVVPWPEPIVSMLQVIGEILAAAVVRVRGEEKQRRVQEDLERRVADRTAQLEAANRELEAFSYAVSHDLRAPLRSVDGFSRILVEDWSDALPGQARDVLGRVCATSRRMGDLIDALLRLSRITRIEPHFEPTDLSAIARDVATGLAASEPSRAVEFRIAEGVVVDGEPRLLRALMDNLLRNAWKFTGQEPVAEIEFGVQGQACFVRDNGVGFDPSQAERIFMPFQRLHDAREFEGHGVGLATVKRIVGVHGGKVWAEARPHEGATIRFTLRRGA